MDVIFLKVLGRNGVIILIGIIVFYFTSRNSESLFEWIEQKTFGMRDFILEKCEFLFYKIEPEKVTYALLGLTFGGALLLFSLFTFTGSITLGVIFGGLFLVFGWQIPKPIMNKLVERRKRKFQSQMVDGLNLMSSGLRAGLSLPQAFGMVVEELPDPIAQEFNLVLQQNRLGVSLDESLDNLNKRMGLIDVEMFTTSIGILRETGGNLTETFDTISEIIRERVRLEQKITSYVSAALFQGRALCLMPFFLLLAYGSTDPKSVKLMFTNPFGLAILAFVVGLVFLGGFFMNKIVKIKA